MQYNTKKPKGKLFLKKNIVHHLEKAKLNDLVGGSQNNPLAAIGSQVNTTCTDSGRPACTSK